MIRFLAALSVFPSVALADVPRVMTDIAPVHSLTAQVMGDLGQPDVLLPPGADPHDYALRPSDAERLGTADLVIWVGESLTPWLEEPLETLAPQAPRFELLEVDGWTKLETRGIDDHGHEDHGHDDHGHDDHGHDDHGHDDHGDEHAHDHGDYDPHAWLDPVVAQTWVSAIAGELSALDPDNAATYSANAKATIAALAALEADLAAQLAGLSERAYILPHDGYQYFETRFGLTAQAAISGIDARTPGPAQIASLREEMTEQNVVCVFSDAEIGDRWATVVIEGTAAKTAEIDGVGVGLAAGPALYGQMLERLAAQFADCLSPNT
ncbi:zinc ABC transporter substrate-binding protein [Loktanella sp. 5RATIMAR09]|uniref:zinc ABC transporter substrate-binding protein n=1 Tax=Loktanella sp. 5RATIMAR09 TaxID=1225655 RepID=UPI0006EBA17F|nr:zinc ABC transporter substrate-binding protein [Loktanella sp. 5RATIMAR09]KQI72407.1 zinc ABC transporter substrate-binding protein [Loktanella sp. 5RATIMAR09]